MSYCVNCGVELEACKKQCPLCGAPVNNPFAMGNVQKESIFAENRDEQKKAEHGFWIKFNSILAVVPIAISLLCNLLYDNKITWSLFVMAGVFILWAAFSTPFIFNKPGYKKIMIADFITTTIGLGTIQLLLRNSNWVLEFAFPVMLYSLLYWLAAIHLIKKGSLMGLLRIVSTIFVYMTVLVLLIEVLLDLYLTGTVTLVWSWFAAAPCLAIVALMLLLDSNKAVKQELAKRLHF